MLVMASASQIQSYIFASNKLREQVGASHLVAQATGAWALEAVQESMKESAGRSNVKNAGALHLDEAFVIEDTKTGSAAEVIYSGGGNVEVLFTERAAADAFVRALSERLLCEAPGLRVAFGRSDFFEWNHGIIGAAEQARKDLEKAKRAMAAGGGGLLGLGVTAACIYTGLPATAVDDGAPISAESKARLDAFDAADERLRRKFERALGDYRFPYDLDKLGRSRGEDSHVAVIHADGNGFGVLRSNALKDAKDDREYVRRARHFSDVIRAIADEALDATLDALCERVRRDFVVHGFPCIRHEIEGRDITIDLKPVKREGDVTYLPVRPIIHGGDDLTVACDGRIALSFAEEYLHQFEAASGRHIRDLKDAPPYLTACAGVAIVRAHFPFARAYELSEELCGEAKKRRAEVQRTAKDEKQEPGSFLDWHIAMSGLIGDLEEIRERDYRIHKRGADAEWLTLRPVKVGAAHDERDVRLWGTIARGTLAFQLDWADKRNKVKALREALRGGMQSVKQFSTNYLQLNGPAASVLPVLPGVDAEKYGWVDKRCAYYDAVELMDMYVPLSAAAVDGGEDKK
jgi:hypothetical protein